MKLFGFEISKKIDKTASTSGAIEIDNTIKSFAIPSQNDGSMLLPAASAAGYYGQILDIDGTSFVNEKDLILKYRAAAGQPECDNAIADITNAAIVSDSKGAPIKLDLDSVELTDKIKDRIFDEFSTILELLDFNYTGYDIFRRWYIDGKIYFHLQVDSAKPKEGIKGIIQIDPLKIKKIKEVTTSIDQVTGIKTNHITAEYFLYSDDFTNTMSGVRIDPNAIVYIPSGVLDESGKVAISYLHKSVKLVNQLRMMEDALVIYRVSRAPERRIFYIDIGNLPKGKAEEYVQGIMAKYRNKLVYDVNSGEIRDDRKSMSMLEDFWLPRREGGRGTEITTLPGGCLAMDTKVSLLDGRDLSILDIELEMKEGKQLWTYSCDEFTGEIKPGLISWAGQTQTNAKVMKITLDNGESLICTPDHKFPVYGQGFVAAEDLSVNSSMIPLYRDKKNIAEYKKLDYEQYFDNSDKKWKYTHRLVGKLGKPFISDYVYDESLEEEIKQINHHIDFNRFNNSPNNICKMSWNDHSKLHADFGFSKEAAALGCIAAKARLERIKNEDPELYKEICLEIGNRTKQMWFDYSNEEYTDHCNKISEGHKKYHSSLTDEEKQIRIDRYKECLYKGTLSLQEKLKDPIFNANFRQKQRDGWSDEAKALASDRAKINNVISWNDPIKGVIRKENHTTNQKLSFDNFILCNIIDLITGKTSHQVSLSDVVELMNSNDECRLRLSELNQNKNVPNWNISIGFTATIIVKCVKQFGYVDWADFRKKESVHNHRIVKIEYLDYTIPVGTLTIDHDELIHNHHTFALSCGIFTKNSNLSEIEDILFFQKKLYRSLNVPSDRLASDSNFSIGRASEISREEVKFQKFISRLRKKFSMMFSDMLRVQCILKGIITLEDWPTIREGMGIDFIEDNFYSELKDFEILQSRIGMLDTISSHIGTYYSEYWVRSNILNMSENDMEKMKLQIDEEALEKKASEMGDDTSSSDEEEAEAEATPEEGSEE